MIICHEFVAQKNQENAGNMNIKSVARENPMNNVIPLKPEPLRKLYELIDSIHDTQLTPEQKRIINEALALVQRIIEAKHGDSQRGHSAS